MKNWGHFLFRVLINSSIAVIAIITILVCTAYLLQSSRNYHDIVIDAPDYSISGAVSAGSDPSGLWVIFVHGNRKVGIAHPLYQAILQNIEKSVSVVGIDMRGYGASSAEGMAGAQRILDREEDIVATVAWIKREFGVSQNRIVLMGHSLGALQVLKAAKNTHFGGVIAIGPGFFERYVSDSKSRFAYIEKFERNTGIRLSIETLLGDAKLFTLPGLFLPCPSGKIFVIHGSREDGMLNARRSDIPTACDALVEWRSIPLSDHMFGTENGFAEPIEGIYSLLVRSILMWQVNRSILSIEKPNNYTS